MPLITTSASPSSVTDIAPTGDHHFVVVWEEASPRIIRGRIITATGENVLARTFAELLDAGPVFTIDADGLGNQTKPSIATGDALFTVGIAYLDDGVPGLGAGRAAVQATTRIFDA